MAHIHCVRDNAHSASEAPDFVYELHDRFVWDFPGTGDPVYSSHQRSLYSTQYCTLNAHLIDWDTWKSPVSCLRHDKRKQRVLQGAIPLWKFRCLDQHMLAQSASIINACVVITSPNHQGEQSSRPLKIRDNMVSSEVLNLRS